MFMIMEKDRLLFKLNDLKLCFSIVIELITARILSANNSNVNIMYYIVDYDDKHDVFIYEIKYENGNISYKYDNKDISNANKDLSGNITIECTRRLRNNLGLKQIDDIANKNMSELKDKINAMNEKLQLLKREFNYDVDLYHRIKKDLDNKVINNIPSMFKDKYELFRNAENNNLLNEKDLLDEYENLKNN